MLIYGWIEARFLVLKDDGAGKVFGGTCRSFFFSSMEYGPYDFFVLRDFIICSISFVDVYLFSMLG